MTPETAPTERREVILHVGMGKTGSTSIQAMCHRSRSALSRAGVLYPRSPGKRRHLRLGLAMQDDVEPPRQSGDWLRQEVARPSELRPILLHDLYGELRGSNAPCVLFSDEALLACEPAVRRNLRELLDAMASHVRVVAYLRRQDDHLCSRYQQAVKLAGETRRLAERVAQMDLAHVYDYRAHLTQWRDVVAPDKLVVRTFEPSRLAGTTLEEDFIAAAGLEIDPADMIIPPARNESLDATCVEFLRILNLWHEERGERPRPRDRNPLVRRLRTRAQSETLTLPDATLDAFMARWEAGNRIVAREFVSGAPESLFCDGRRTAGTTTVQALDPEQLPELLELSQVPARHHHEIHRIAAAQATA